MSQRTTGLLIALVGTLAATPDAALLRAMNLEGGSENQITFWRYIMVGFISLFIGAYNEGVRRPRSTPGAPPSMADAR